MTIINGHEEKFPSLFGTLLESNALSFMTKSFSIFLLVL